jgi:iron complex outermembrane receptor protein
MFIRCSAALLAAALLLACAEVKVEAVDATGAAIPGAVVEPAGGALRVSAPGFAARTLKAPRGGGTLRVMLYPLPLVTAIDVVVRDASVVEEGAVTTSTALEIERTGARTVFDAIDRLLPSAFVTRRGVMGYGIATNGTGSVTVRGIGGSPNTGVLVVVDGRPEYQALMGHPVPDLYTLSDAASVRITQGPASVLYGSNAMGGAIEIRPARPEAGMSTRLTTSLGSWWTTQNRLQHGSRFEKAFYTVNAGYSATSGDRPSSDFRNPDATMAVGGDLGEHWKSSLQGRYGWFHVEDPGPVNAPLSNSYARVGRGGYDLNFDNAYSRSHGYARVYGSWGKHYITDGFRSTDSIQGGRAMQTFLLHPSLTMDLGGETNFYGGTARNVRQSLNYGEHRLKEGAGFGRAQWNAGPRVLLNGGFRYHQHSAYGGLPVPELNATFRLAPKYSISGGFSRGFRHPTIRELYLFPAPNPQLQPEKLWNYEGTLHAHPAAWVTAWATYFYADIANQIVTIGRFPNLQLRNAGSALNRGVETSVHLRPLRSITVSAGYAWLRSTNLAPLIPENKLNASVQWQKGNYSTSLSAMAVGRRWANAARTQQLDSYALLTWQNTLRLSKRWSVFSLVDNLLNQDYQVLPGYPMPGINAMGGLSLTF